MISTLFPFKIITMKTLLKNAQILSMKSDSIFHGSILIEDGIIKKISKMKIEVDSKTKVIDCENNLLMPGFKNMHGHSAMVFLRNRSDDVPLNTWLFKHVFPHEEKLSFEDAYYFNKLAIFEYLSSGITFVLDQYLYPEATVKACLKYGFKLGVLLTYPNQGDKETTRRRWEALLLNFNNHPHIRPSLSMHSEYTALKDQIDLCQEFTIKYHLPFFVHASETIKEVDECLSRHNGLSPIAYFDSLGLFQNGGAIFHGIHLANDDIDILKKNNMSVVSCPGSNIKLASGICDIKKLLDSGINVALGTDGAASNNSLNMFKEMYLASGLAKLLNKDAASIKAFDILKMATVNGSRCTSFNNDYLEEGKEADIIMINLQDPSIQPVSNIINSLVYSCSKRAVKMTMINGKILYYDGKYFLKDDYLKVVKKCQRILNKIFEE